MSYVIKNFAGDIALNAPWDGEQWSKANELKVDTVVKAECGHIPDVRIKMLYNEKYVCGLFKVDDQYVRAVAEKDQDSVCTDSCVEFFVKPQGAECYYNFEFNCGGTLLLFQVNDLSKKDYEVIPQDELDTIKRFHTMPKIVEPEITEKTTWFLGFAIPIEFFAKRTGVDANLKGQVWTANFTKCADKTSKPHWLSWMPLPRVAFHLPECFGEISFE